MRGETNCPRCNSLQKFRRKVVKYRTDDNEERAKVRIKCRMCKWESVVMDGTPREIRIRLDIERLEAAEKRGSPVSRMIKQRRESLAKELNAQGRRHTFD